MPAHDRLAVWTYHEYGEEIPQGDPSVTDAERAAAGRETVAARFQALLPGNRSRAAAQYAAGELPAGEDAVRVWRPRDPAVLYARLGGQPLAAWAEDDVLHVLWQGQAEQVQLGGGIQPQLWPAEGAADLWEASLRIRGLEETVLTMVVMPQPPGPAAPGQIPDMLVWRGPRAAAAGPEASKLTGTVTEDTLDSAALGAPRPVTVYRPPVPAGPLPGCLLADGQSATGFARVLEPAILAGSAPPVLLVGVHNAGDPAHPWVDRRAQEYLPRHSRRRFAAHLSFVTDSVIPWAVRRFGAAGGPWTSAGFSNGAAWAIAAAQRRPDVFATVAAFSAGVVPGRLAGRAAGVRHYLAAGRLEPGFRRATREWADRLRRAGRPVEYTEWAGGHDPYWWDQQLPVALGWLLAPG